MYLLSLPESEVLPQEQSELRQETHYGLSWQYPAKASLWQLAHLINPGGNKRQSLVLIQRSNASWGSATNHSLPQAYGAAPVLRIIITYTQQISGWDNVGHTEVTQFGIRIFIKDHVVVLLNELHIKLFKTHISFLLLLKGDEAM